MKKLSELFDLRYGHSLELNHLTLADSERGIAFVSRKNRDNGVSAYVEPVKGLKAAPAGELTVALGGQGGALSTFLQERPFYTGRDVEILKSKTPLSKATLLFYCMCIQANHYRYGFGRQANRTLKDLLVPESCEFPTWVEQAGTLDLAGKDAPAVAELTPTLNTADWRPFRLSALFDVKKGKRLIKQNRVTGPIPFIGALDRNNGLVEYIGRTALHPAGTITVNYDGIGGLATAFYQPTAYWCSDSVNALYPRFELSPAIALFISTIIRREKYRFSYGRKWHLERMRESEIHLPSRQDGTPDWAFMERYINSLPYSSQI